MRHIGKVDEHRTSVLDRNLEAERRIMAKFDESLISRVQRTDNAYCGFGGQVPIALKIASSLYQESRNAITASVNRKE